MDIKEEKIIKEIKKLIEPFANHYGTYTYWDYKKVGFELINWLEKENNENFGDWE